MIAITPTLSIPTEELRFTVSRSSGPGGQHVNKTSTRVTLLFDVEASPSLSAHQKELVRTALAGRLTSEGLLQVSAQRRRSQVLNREAAVARFAELLRMALQEKPPRRPGQLPPEVRLRILADKRRRGRLKRERAGVDAWHDG